MVTPNGMAFLPNAVRVLDTTLRDGEQSPGVILTADEKLEIAGQLARLGVDYIEAGFPASSPGDLNAAQRIATLIGDADRVGRDGVPTPPPGIVAMARATDADVDIAWEGIRSARFPRLHIVLATSDIHLEYKLKKSRMEVLRITEDAVRYASHLCGDVQFSPEDATRSDPGYLVEVLEAAVEAGATTLNIPDTVGFATPNEFGSLIAKIRQHFRDKTNVTLSVHCHDDLGMGTANTLAGLLNGARQVEVTINGIGERAGNACLAETAVALHTRNDFFGLRTGINLKEIYPTSRLVAELTGMAVQRNKSVVGENAFSHQAGIHQDGILKNPLTYEVINSADLGFTGSKLVLGRNSGRSALRSKLQGLGFDPNVDEFDVVYKRFKNAADRKVEVDDAELCRIWLSSIRHVESVAR